LPVERSRFIHREESLDCCAGSSTRVSSCLHFGQSIGLWL
jgi:hypothetical protein